MSRPALEGTPTETDSAAMSQLVPWDGTDGRDPGESVVPR